MKTKTKNKLKAIIAKSKKEHVIDVMLTYNWKQVKFITVKVEGNTFAAVREAGNIIKPFTFYDSLRTIAKNTHISAKGKLVIFAVVKVVDSVKTEQLKKDQERRYGKYFGTYVSERQLTALL